MSASWTSRVRLEVMTTIGRLLGADGADLRDGDLEVGEHLEQERLELLVGAVDLVDEQDRRHAVVRLDRLEQRALDQKLGAKIRDASRRRACPSASSSRIWSIWRG